MEREIDLRKGRSISLTKGISKLKVTVSWENNLRACSDQDYDIDLIAVECKSQGSDRYKCLNPDYLVFYGSDIVSSAGDLTDPDEAVVYGGDDRGDSGDSGSEEMIVLPKKINSEVTDIFFIISIYEASSRNQKFELIKNTEVKIYEDNKDTPKLVYRLDEDSEFKNSTVLILGDLTREEGKKFNFKAIGAGYNEELSSILRKYGLKVI